jgi:hypothetical protein
VPLPHLLKERETRHEYEDKVKALEEQIDELKGRVDQAPDYDEDPRAYIDHNFERIGNKQVLTQEQITGMIEDKLQDYIFQNALVQDVTAAREKHKDYDDALEYARTLAFNQHLLSGLDQKAAVRAVNDGEIQMAKALLSQGQSAAEAIYEYAKTSGYKSKSEKRRDDKIDKITEGQKASTPTGSGDAPVEPKEGDVDLFDQAMGEAFAHLRRK